MKRGFPPLSKQVTITVSPTPITYIVGGGGERTGLRDISNRTRETREMGRGGGMLPSNSREKKGMKGKKMQHNLTYTDK